MSGARNKIWIATLCLAMSLCGAAARGDAIQVSILATASELGGQEPDVFGVGFNCSHDIRIQQIIYDLTFATGNLHFDTVPHDNGAYDFTVLPDHWFPATISADTGASHLSADNSPHLVINFSHFQPGEILYFAIDVDGSDNGAWTAEQFAGTKMGVVFDLAPAFPESDLQAVVLTFENREGLVIAQFDGEVPEPATLGLMLGGAGLLVTVAKRKKH